MIPLTDIERSSSNSIDKGRIEAKKEPKDLKNIEITDNILIPPMNDK